MGELLSADDRDRAKCAATIDACQKILRSMTGIILASFLLIVTMTTVSTAPVVQFAAKTLYYLILASAVTSLVGWVVRVRFQKRLEKSVNATAEALRKL